MPGRVVRGTDQGNSYDVALTDDGSVQEQSRNRDGGSDAGVAQLALELLDLVAQAGGLFEAQVG
jgi:hypothetical protein